MWDITNTPPCRHNVFVVSHGIAEPNRQTPLTEPNKPPHRGQGSALIPFVTTHTQPCRYCPLWAQEGPHGLKRVYLVKRSLYIYSTRNILPYPMWDITGKALNATYSSLPIPKLRPATALFKLINGIGVVTIKSSL